MLFLEKTVTLSSNTKYSSTYLFFITPKGNIPFWGYAILKALQRYLLLLALFSFLLTSCEKETEDNTPPIIVFKFGEYTADGQYVPVGGKLSFGIAASEGGAPLTNFRVQRIADGNVITEVDKGMFVPSGGIEQTVNAVKSPALVEEWRFMVMNANRDSAVISRTINLGEGSAYGPIRHFESVTIGMQDNDEYPHFLDLNSGVAYSNETVTGNESAIDLLAFVYYTGGKWSPTLNCPGYGSISSYYPAVAQWETANTTLYDYNSVDNDLVDPLDFAAAANDSLLIYSFNPQTANANCKYCYTGKIIPFRTEEGKFGLIRVLHADEVSSGYMELEIKIQE